MARVKLTIPGSPVAEVSIPVRITDINYGNHVGNDAFVGLIHDARMQWLRRHGYTELDIEGVGLIMSDLAVEFKSEAFYGDTIQIKISVGEITSVAFELYYSLSAIRDGNIIIAAYAKTGMVCYDYAVKKVTPIPEKLKAILSAVTG